MGKCLCRQYDWLLGSDQAALCPGGLDAGAGQAQRVLQIPQRRAGQVVHDRPIRYAGAAC